MYARAIALAASLALSAPHAEAQDRTVELKLSHFMPPSHPLHKALEDWAASIEKASRGAIDYKIYPAQQLGKAFDQHDMVRDRIADVSLVVPSYQPGRFPIIAASELPFSISAGGGGSRALDAWYREYAGNEMRDVKFCLAFVHHPGTFHANRKIMVPDDVRGMSCKTILDVFHIGNLSQRFRRPEKNPSDRPWGSRCSASLQVELLLRSLVAQATQLTPIIRFVL